MSHFISPSWKLGDVDVKIGNASLQTGYKDVSPTSRSRKRRPVATAAGLRALRTPRLFLPPR